MIMAYCYSHVVSYIGKHIAMYTYNNLAIILLNACYNTCYLYYSYIENKFVHHIATIVSDQ